MISSERSLSSRFVPILVLAVLVAGCASIGPKTIPRDQFDYTNAIADSWKRQMLLNIVKLRYGEPPVFLDVASVINQYSLEGQASLGGAFNGGLTGKHVYNVGANARYADRPTITYQPLSGEKFTRALLTPVPPDRLLALANSGYPIAFVARLGVRSLGGVRNHVDVEFLHQPADPEFEPLIEALTRIQQSNSLGIRLRASDTGATAAIFFSNRPSRETLRDFLLVREMLGLSEEVNEYRVVYGLPANDRELAIQSRSIMEMLLELGSDIDTPAEDVERGRARPTTEHEDEEPLIRIRSGADRPQDAFAATFYGGSWFWIEDDDLSSKSTLTFMMILSSIAETGSALQAPLVTVSAGQ